MLNPYAILALPNKYKEISLETLESSMEAHWSASKDIYSQETYEKFMNKVKNEPEENKKKEMVFNRLAFVKYYYLFKNQKGKDTTLLKEAYEMIKTEERRRLYDEKIKKQDSQLNMKEVQEGLANARERYQKEWEQLKKVPLTKRMIDSVIEEPGLTKGVTSMEDLKRSQEKNKRRVDPENRFKQYTGYPYRWGFTETILPDACIINEKNKKNEHVIVIKLGEFNYQTLIQAPTKEYPEGKATYQDKADIIGVSKLDSNGNLLRNDIVIAHLSSEDRMQNREFFREVFVSDERIDQANLKNHGFIGSVSHREDGSCYIKCNSTGDRELVTALGFSNHIGGVQNKKFYDKKVGTFDKVKESFKKMQTYYIESMMKRKEQKSKSKGEDAWEK